MSSELEAAGGLVTAGLAAHVVDGTQLGRDHGIGHGPCRNCAAPLAGAYCHACGQSAHIHRSLLHLAEEALHGLLHFDAKAARTLPLLVVRPGVLTRRYIEGQRTRYVSPLALFLFMVFLMFFAASFLHPGVSVAKAEALADLQSQVAEAAKAKADADARLKAVVSRGEDPVDAQSDADDAGAELAALETARNVAKAAAVASAASAGAATADDEPARPAWSVAARRRIHTGHPALDAALVRALANPELSLYELKSNAYKFSFVLVPLSVPFLWLVFLTRRDLAVYDHAVFVLYSLSFMSLLFVAMVALGSNSITAAAVAPLCLAPPLHIALQLRDAYRLSIAGTLWRTAVLMVVALIVFLLFVLFVVAVTVGR